MALIDAGDFVERYTIFAELNPDIIDSEIAIALFSFPSSKFPDETIQNQLIGLQVAHNMLLEYKDQLLLADDLRLIEEGKELNKQQLSKTDFLDLTIYGQKLKSLINRTCGRAVSMFVP